MVKEYKNGNIHISMTAAEKTDIVKALGKRGTMTVDVLHDAMFDYICRAMEQIGYVYYKGDLMNCKKLNNEPVMVHIFMRGGNEYVYVSWEEFEELYNKRKTILHKT